MTFFNVLLVLHLAAFGKLGNKDGFNVFFSVILALPKEVTVTVRHFVLVLKVCLSGLLFFYWGCPSGCDRLTCMWQGA